MNRERLASARADRYTIERELGQGGMATVEVAKDGQFVFLGPIGPIAGRSIRLVHVDHWFADLKAKLKQ